MNSRERVLLALNHEQTDILPFSLGFGLNEPVLKALAAEMKLPDARDAKALVESKSANLAQETALSDDRRNPNQASMHTFSLNYFEKAKTARSYPTQEDINVPTFLRRIKD